MKRFVLPILLAAALPAADPGIVPGMNAFTAASYKQLAGGDANLILSPFNIAPEREKSSRCGGTRWYLGQHYGLVPDHEFSEAETLPPRSRTGAPR